MQHKVDIETLIIGAGVVGLAVARALAMAGHEVIVLERHGLIGSETSARNSEVIHAGIYYPKGSLKALTCVRGKRLLYEFCQTHHVPHNPIGKLIVATNDHQIADLENIQQKAMDNGVGDLKFLNTRDVVALEPDLACVGALFSPSTGIIDSHAYMLALLGDAEDHGTHIGFNSPVSSWQVIDGGFRVFVGGEQSTELTAKNLVFSAGLDGPEVFNGARIAGLSTPQPTEFAKGNYFRLNQRSPFSHLIYPVPEPGGLGVHLTLDLGGQARFGPDVEWVSRRDYEVDPARGDHFYASIRQYWPGLPNGALEADYSGIRPKLVGREEPGADFHIYGPREHGHSGLVALLGIESPGLTASLALAELVEDQLN